MTDFLNASGNWLHDILPIFGAVVGILIFVWAFIFTATYAAFRAAQRPPRLRKQPATGATRYPASWNTEHQDTPEQETKQRRSRKGSRPRGTHGHFGPTEIRTAPGPRDWTPPPNN